MSARLSSVAGEIEDAEVLIIDAAAHEWCCGWAESNGPDVVLPGVAFGDHAAWRSAMAEVFEKMEAEPSEVAVLICEPPGVTAADREHVASTLFGEHRVCALHVAAAPVLALYNTGFTGIVVDVGAEAAAIHAIYEGAAVLPAATLHPLADAVPLHEAVLRTANLADFSMRGALLHAVVLAGQGSAGGDFAAQLERDLGAALDATKWQPRVVARADRRLAVWLGGAILASIPSSVEHFVARVEHTADPAELGRRCPPLATLGLEAQEAERRRGSLLGVHRRRPYACHRHQPAA